MVLQSPAAEVLNRASPGKGGVLWLRSTRMLPFVVAPASVDRALRVMNAMARALEARGFEVGA
jgi:hypothetical protein